MSKIRIFSLFIVISAWLSIIGSMVYIQLNTPKDAISLKTEAPIININPSKAIQSTELDNPPDPAGPSFNSLFAISDQNQPKTNVNSQTSTNIKPQNSSKIPIRLPTGEAVPTTDQTGQANSLDYPNLKIKAPILFASLNDLFEKNPDGTVDTNRQIQEVPNDKTHLSTPVQRLLTKGIVHLGFTSLPGEYGNSYIVGHSSNYANVISNYNYIFKDLKNAKSGDLFTIYNKDGKGMNFRVFENIVVNDSDIDRAYSDFNDKRVVTLQASVLVRVNGNLLPLKRQLVRGELIN